MKIGLIGQGPSALFLSIMLKKKYDDIEIFLIDKNKVIGKKLFVTGNGRCNLGNNLFDKNSYGNAFADQLVLNGSIIDEEINFFKSIGIKTRYLNNLLYPFSLSAKQFTNYIIDYAKKLGVNFINEEEVIDYKVDENIKIKTNRNIYEVDKLIIATGGKSNPNLGSTGVFFTTLENHGYKINNLLPGLCPIKTAEITKLIENERLKCKVSLYCDNNLIYEEVGEVLFKNNGLSGIAIMNCSSMIARTHNKKGFKISLDLLPDLDEKDLVKELEEIKEINSNFLEGYFTKKINDYINYLFEYKNIKFNPKNVASLLKNFDFYYLDNYGFEDSQVTIGGVDLNNVNNDLSSKIEKNTYLIGEVLDLDGLCGGYNLMLCFAEALKVANSIQL